MQPLSGTPRRTPVLEALHDVETVIMKGALLLKVVNVEKHVFTRAPNRLSNQPWHPHQFPYLDTPEA